MQAGIRGARPGSARSAIPRRTTRTSPATGSGIVMTVVALCRRQSATTEREAPMTDPARHVHVVDDVPELDALEHGPVLVHSLEGFLDAGNAAALATRHLLAQSSGRVVASFDIDAFYDYRARRPPMTFSENRYEGYETPRLVVRLNHDSLGTPYLLMHGPEPDTHWEAFANAVRTVVEKLRVRLTVSMGAVPMAVPHTRPVMLTNHATAPG